MRIDTPLTDNAIPISKTDLTKRFVRSPLTIAVITTFGLLPVSGMASQVIKPTGIWRSQVVPLHQSTASSIWTKVKTSS